jgi:hypothetical protein
MCETPRFVSTAASAATPPPVYRTKNTDAAAYLICFHKMRYLGARRCGRFGHDVQFQIEDLEKLAELRARDFRCGDPIPADPRALLQTHRFLRSEIQRVHAEVPNGRSTSMR